MDIGFKACGQRLSRLGPLTRPVAGSRGYLTARFELDENWNGLRIAARFFDEGGAEHAALVKDGGCPVPNEVADSRWFRVALKGVGDGRTLTTNAVTVEQEVV